MFFLLNCIWPWEFFPFLTRMVFHIYSNAKNGACFGKCLTVFPLISAFLLGKKMEGEKQMRGCIKLLLLIALRYWNQSVLCGSNLIAFAVWWGWEDHVPVWTPGSTWTKAIKGSVVQGKFTAIFFSPWLQNKKENSYVCNVFGTLGPGARAACFGF